MVHATFAAGCFWGIEAAYRQISGVTDAMVGYTGGQTENPTYQHVCNGDTGHAEAVLVTFDPEKVSYAELVSLFWQIHNPTTLNRQGPDVGSQYRSAIFYHDETQRQIAEASKTAAQAKWPRPIVTEIVPAQTFYKAEEYHQNYAAKHGRHCSL